MSLSRERCSQGFELSRLLSEACGLFDQAVVDADPLPGTILALENICRAAEIGVPLRSHMAEPPERPVKVMGALAVRIAGEVSARIAPARVYFGMGSAASLIADNDEHFRRDRQLHACALTAELKLFTYDRELERAGNSLVRAMKLVRVWDTAGENGVLQ